MNTLREFELKPAANGGVVVFGQEQTYGSPLEMLGAFSTPADMIRWLCEQYRIPADVIFASGGVPIVNELVGERAGESIAPTDNGWISWSGHSMLECDKGLPCMIRMRNRQKRQGKTFDHVERWRWSINEEAVMTDVVAYRVML